MKTLRLGLIGLASAVAGFTLQGCFAAQPTPECQVAIAEAAFGLAPYYVKLTNVEGAGSCGTLDHMYMGTQRFRVPDSNTYRVGYRASVLMDHALGYTLEANVDPSNDCTYEEDCEACVFTLADGGLATALDGGAVEEFPLPDGGSEYGLDDGMGDYTPIDVDNECKAVPEAVYRYDANDPDGKDLVGFGKLPQYPTDNVCRVTDFTGASQVFAEEVEVDGTVIPELPVKLEWENLDVLMTSKVPGTAFTGKVKITEGTCTATYEAFAFWPAIHCSTQADYDDLIASGHEDCAGMTSCTAEEARGIVNRDCDPYPNLEQGRAYGSGINPLFEPVCNLERGICEPGVDVLQLK